MFFPPLLNPVAAIGGPTPFIHRYLTTLTSALSQRLEFPAWKPQGSFEIEGDFATTASDDELLAGTLEAEDCIVLDIVGDQVQLSCYIGATLQTVISATVSAHNDGHLHRAKITYNDTTNVAELLIDDVSAGTATWVLDGNQDIAFAGKRGADYGSNTPANIKLTDAGNTDNRDYPINESWADSNVLVDVSGNGRHGTFINGNETDVELFTLNTALTPDEWWNVTAPQMLSYSNDFANGWWTKDKLSVSGEEITLAVDNSAHQLFDIDKISFERSVNYTSSLKVKAGTESKVRLQAVFWDAAWSLQDSSYVDFDLVLGTVIFSSGGYLVDSNIAQEGDYYTCSLTFNISAVDDIVRRRACVFVALDAGRNATFTGDGTSVAYYLKSAQVEKGSVATAHKITTDNPGRRIEVAY